MVAKRVASFPDVIAAARAAVSTPRAYDANALRESAVRILCYSETDVRNAIARASVAKRPAGGGAPGLEIIIGGPISVSRPFVIPDTASGITIRSTSRQPISPVGTVTSLFSLQGTVSKLTLDGLEVVKTDTGFFSALFVNSEDATHIGVTRCTLRIDSLIVSTSGSLEKWRITENVFRKASATAALMSGTLDSFTVSNNDVSVAGGDFFVTTGNNNGLVNNNVNGTAINTAAGTGSNTIVANRGTSAGALITSDATDAVGLNT